jgi:uncharacterized protein (TIGR02145 family)
LSNLYILLALSALLLFHIQCSVNTTEPVIENTVTDIDGNIYTPVRIGEQWWMAENLKVTHFRNGEAIAYVENNNEWASRSQGAYCFYENDDVYKDVYGLLYNWYAVNSPLNIAPKGWHVASDDEWNELEIYLGMDVSETAYVGFRGNDQGAQLRDGNFSALCGGFRGVEGYSALWRHTDIGGQVQSSAG